jgi:hypothetical protein
MVQRRISPAVDKQSSVRPSFRTRVYRMRQAVSIQPDRAACGSERKDWFRLACGDRCFRSETSGGQQRTFLLDNRHCPTGTVSWSTCRLSGSPLGTAWIRQKGQAAHGRARIDIAAGARCCVNISTASVLSSAACIYIQPCAQVKCEYTTPGKRAQRRSTPAGNQI